MTNDEIRMTRGDLPLHPFVIRHSDFVIHSARASALHPPYTKSFRTAHSAACVRSLRPTFRRMCRTRSTTVW